LKRLLVNPWFGLACRVLLGGVFIYASLPKLANPAGFAVNVSRYQLLPLSLVNLVALILPWVELLSGALLLVGWLSRSSGILLTLVSAVFLAAVGSAIARGLDIECGCFQVGGGGKVGWPHFVLDLALLLLALRCALLGGGALALDGSG
jgi:uncharacterized membrane protein YphA (DoxX/SURF4 family)